MPLMGADGPLVEGSMPLSLEPVDEHRVSVGAVGCADAGGGGSSGAAQGADGADGGVAAVARLSRGCCTPPPPPCPATLAEAMEEACKCSMGGDLLGLQVALNHARTFDGFAMNAQGTQARTPLYQACLCRQPEVVRWLLEQPDYVPDTVQVLASRRPNT
jgi:hypothetical protein